MSSDSIYQNIAISTKVLPYVYKCTHKLSKKFYFGVRTANKIPPELDFPRYKTSSPAINKNFADYEWEIVALFYEKTDAFDYEQFLIYENLHSPDIINRKCFYGKERFLTVSKISVKDINGNTMSVFSNDPRLKTKELVSVTTGLTVVKDCNGRNLKVAKDDPRIKTGELKRFQTGRRWMNNSTEMRLVDPANVPDYLSKGYTFGKLPQIKHCFNIFVWVNNTIKNKRISSTELDQHLADGWVRGHLKNK